MNPRELQIYKTRIRRERLKREAEARLGAFGRQAWPIIEPGRPFEHGWHIDCISEHLQAVGMRQIRNLLINIPPRHMKSTLVCVLWPAWQWGPNRNPHEGWMFGSYTPKLSTRDAEKCRKLIDSAWYRSNWKDVFIADDDRKKIYTKTNSLMSPTNNKVMDYSNIHSGRRIATSIGGVGVGEGGDILVADDPHKINTVESDTMRNKSINWWRDEMSTRGNDPKTVCRVVVMQRVHDTDLCGALLDDPEIDYDLLCLPYEYEKKIFIDLKPTGIGFRDPRKKEGERLWHRFNGKPGDDLKKMLKPYQRSGQLQQRPSAREGTIFMRNYFKNRWTEMPPRFDFFINSWDLTFGTGEQTGSGKKNQGAFDVGYALGWFRGKYYVVDEVRRRLEPYEQEVATAGLKQKWGKFTRGVLIEDAANGRATAKKIKRKVSGVILIRPDGSKEERALANTTPFQAGDVLFPVNEYAPWVEEAIEEIVNFSSRAKYKDRVDALIQGVDYLEPKIAAKMKIGDVEFGSMEKASIWTQAG